MVEPPSDSDSTQLKVDPSLSVFVGRQREMGVLRTVLDDAISSKDRLVMLIGEPGIGITRVAKELAGQPKARA